MKIRTLMFALVPAFVLASLGACSDDATTGSPTADSGTADQSNGGNDSAVTDSGTDSNKSDSSADADADAGPVISSDPQTPTPLAIGASVSAQLAADAEHFFEFTTVGAGDYTLHFTSPSGQYYASFASVKGGHSCGLPSCVQGTGTAPLTGLTAATTYYLNLYNGSPGAGGYTISVTNP